MYRYLESTPMGTIGLAQHKTVAQNGQSPITVRWSRMSSTSSERNSMSPIGVLSTVACHKTNKWHLWDHKMLITYVCFVYLQGLRLASIVRRTRRQHSNTAVVTHSRQAYYNIALYIHFFSDLRSPIGECINTLLQGVQYRVILQTRVDPKKILVVKKATDEQTKTGEYWLAPDAKAIRPYAVCIYKIH